MKKLISLIMTISLFAVLLVPANAASKADIESEIQYHINMKNKIHEAAELLRTAGYTDDSVAIQALKNDWTYENNRHIELQKELDEINASTPTSQTFYWDGPVLTRGKGVNYGPTGKETYYNLNMSGVVSIMRNRGYDSTNYPYWVRNDGCKMLGPYIMAAANLNHFPRGSLVPSSLGMCICVDTGHLGWNHIDIAVNWKRRKTIGRKQ